jgi:hypothetical protein
MYLVSEERNQFRITAENVLEAATWKTLSLALNWSLGKQFVREEGGRNLFTSVLNIALWYWRC